MYNNICIEKLGIFIHSVVERKSCLLNILYYTVNEKEIN